MYIPSLQELFHAHVSMVTGSYISSPIHYDWGTVVTSPYITDAWWNFILLYKAPKKISEYEAAKSELLTNQRDVVIWLPAHLNTVDIRNLLGLSHQIDRESWLWSNIGELKSCGQEVLQLCREKSDLDIFIDIFYRAYSGDNEKEAYGALPPSYGETWKLAFHQGKQLKLYLVCNHTGPVGCLGLGFQGKWASVYGLGLIPEARGSYLWRDASLAALQIAKKQGAELTFAMTPPGSANEKLYSRAGLKVLDTLSCWS